MRKMLLLLPALIFLSGCETDPMATVKGHFVGYSKASESVIAVVNGQPVRQISANGSVKFNATIQVPDQNGGTKTILGPDPNDNQSVRVTIQIKSSTTGVSLAGPIQCNAGGKVLTQFTFDPAKTYEFDKLQCFY